jgi:thiol-disulfide isomerase/thioredoxin
MIAGTAKASPIDLAAYKGKVVYLDFWASWCKPCRESFPWMNELTESFGGKGLVVIAVNVDHKRDLATDFLRQNTADFKIVYDPDGDLAEKYNVQAMPTSILIGRDGRIRYVHSGFYPGKEFDYLAHIRKLLNQKVS